MKCNVIFLFCLSLLLSATHPIYAGCERGNCSNGFGEMRSRSYSYSGNFQSGLFNGKGKLTFANGNLYEGQFTNGFIDGFGKFSYQTGHVYVGNFVKNAKSGKGKMLFSNKDIYNGEWENDEMQGQGIYYFADGGKYEGEFVKSQFHGKGKMTLANNVTKSGIWQENKFLSAPAQSAISNQRKNCNNAFCDGEQGEYAYGDGTKYFGFFVGGKPEGTGITTYANGDFYKGDWKNDAPNGYGFLRKKNGVEVKGQWRDGRLIKSESNTSLANQTPKKEVLPTKNYKKADGVSEIYSLVVGIANYNTMPSLKYTDDDAYQFYAFMKSPEGGAIEDDHISLLIDDAAIGTKIVNKLKEIVNRADADDAIIIYLSGHGLNGGFVPFDFQSGSGTIPYQDILAIVDGSAAKNKLCIADACYSGSMSQNRSPYLMGLEEFYTKINTSKGGTALIMSSQNQEVSLEYSGLRQGIFSHYLIQGLKGAANAQADRIITVAELYNYISANVRKYTANAQNPVIAGDFDESMPVAVLRR
ncbi:MAG: caspase family protein [Saprospiraceae bacterium]|nr:caspase family protein [Saprospiraceae bacterium]MBP7643803.1 caspase family protein [Saprospiraceae bacterium]